jgi:hypothetical protein
MDFVKKFAGGNSNEQAGQQGSAQQVPTQQGQGQQSGGGFLGGIGNKLNSAAGGGPESEKNEDYLDKGKHTTLLFTFTVTNTNTYPQVSTLSKRSSWDRVLRYLYPLLRAKHHILIYPQNNESAIEQAKDEQISDFIRKQWKTTTGSDIPIKDKETRF